MANILIARRPHKLAVWLDDKGMKPAQFASALDVNVRTVDRWIEGSNFPSLEMAQRIHVETDGFVSLMDWGTEFVTRRRQALERVEVKVDPKAKAGKPRKAASHVTRRKTSPTKRPAARPGKVTTST